MKIGIKVLAFFFTFFILFYSLKFHIKIGGFMSYPCSFFDPSFRSGALSDPSRSEVCCSNISTISGGEKSPEVRSLEKSPPSEVRSSSFPRQALVGTISSSCPREVSCPSSHPSHQDPLKKKGVADSPSSGCCNKKRVVDFTSLERRMVRETLGFINQGVRDVVLILASSKK